MKVFSKGKKIHNCGTAYPFQQYKSPLSEGAFFDELAEDGEVSHVTSRHPSASMEDLEEGEPRLDALTSTSSRPSRPPNQPK